MKDVKFFGLEDHVEKALKFKFAALLYILQSLANKSPSKTNIFIKNIVDLEY